MSRGRGTASIVASPVLIGAVTTLIVIVSVFLAYNANKGLPFVPTYDVSAQVPGGANLVEGNEVRVGGFRVGIVDTIRTRFRRTPPDGKLRAIAVLDLKLDKKVEPLAVDSTLIVRPRSALGLKYVEISPGHSKKTYNPGSTIPLERAGNPVEFDDLLNTFDESNRQYQQDSLVGFGDALAGRGADLNEAIASLSPFFDALTPVMQNLSDPRTRLQDFFKEIGETSAEVRPVARLQAELFGLMADTFDAITSDPDAFRLTIEKTPETLDAGIRSLPIQRPFIEDFTDLSRRLRPTARILPTALDRINPALRTGIQVLPQTVRLNQELGDTFDALTDLVENPDTLLALRDLRTTTTVGAPLLEYVSPYQSVCSYGNYFFAGLGGHISEGTQLGTAERVIVKSDNENTQDNKWSDFPADRPADVPADVDPSDAITPNTPPGAEEEREPPGRPHPAVRPGDRRQGQRRLPDRQLGLHRRPAGEERPLPAGQRQPDLRRRRGGRQPRGRRRRHARPGGPDVQRRPELEGRPLMAIFNRGKKKGSGMSPVMAGAIATVIIAVAVFFAFSALNPFHHPYTFTATFKSANNLKPKSPVRIAGVEVGVVKKVEPIPEGDGAAEVTMEVEKAGLPIHKDAQLKVRPRIFLEGNFFVDIQPGTPGSEDLKDGGNIPVNQTETPVQFGQILTALQSDTREDLKDFLREYATNGLGNGKPQGQSDEPTGADYYNQSLDDAPDALKNVSIANDATLGRHPGDLQRVIK